MFLHIFKEDWHFGSIIIALDSQYSVPIYPDHRPIIPHEKYFTVNTMFAGSK